MKNGVECYKDFFGYFNALETHGAEYINYRAIHMGVPFFLDS